MDHLAALLLHENSQRRSNCKVFHFLNACKKRPNGICTYSFKNCQNCRLKKCDGIPSSLPTSNDQVDGERKGPVLQGYQQKSRLPLHIKDQDHPSLAYK